MSQAEATKAVAAEERTDEARSFVHSFVKEVVVKPGMAAIETWEHADNGHRPGDMSMDSVLP